MTGSIPPLVVTLYCLCGGVCLVRVDRLPIAFPQPVKDTRGAVSRARPRRGHTGQPGPAGVADDQSGHAVPCPTRSVSPSLGASRLRDPISTSVMPRLPEGGGASQHVQCRPQRGRSYTTPDPFRALDKRVSRLVVFRLSRCGGVIAVARQVGTRAYSHPIDQSIYPNRWRCHGAG